MKTTRDLVFPQKAVWRGATREHPPSGAVTEAQRSQTAFCAKTLRAAVLLAVVDSALKARCGDSRASSPRLWPKSLAARPLVVFKQALRPATARPAFTHSLIRTSPVVFRLRRNTDKTTFHLVTGHRPLAIESRNLFKESALHSIATPFDRSGGGLSLESRPEPAFRKDYPVVRAALISRMSQARAWDQ